MKKGKSLSLSLYHVRLKGIILELLFSALFLLFSIPRAHFPPNIIVEHD